MGHVAKMDGSACPGGVLADLTEGPVIINSPTSQDPEPQRDPVVNVSGINSILIATQDTLYCHGPEAGFQVKEPACYQPA